MSQRFHASAPQGMAPEGRQALVVGVVLAIVVFAIPFVRFVASYLDVIAHELGHTLAGWSFGYPSVPAFDWRYGGGVTLNRDRSTLIVLLIYGLFAFVVVTIRDHVRSRNIALGLVALYSFTAFSPLHEVVLLAMGHAMELVIAGVFVYRAMSGEAIAHAVERPLYAACGFLILINNGALAWGLITDAGSRAAYGAAKGGGHWMDLSRIAQDYLGVGLPAVAFVLLLSALMTPLLSYLAFRRGTALIRWVLEG
ncbi:MAG: hypothetical protein K0U98_19015 [Deltaproteobacteria bacterium]|nr:hypothetical protein [Deltaproteobacteria bacterium]